MFRIFFKKQKIGSHHNLEAELNDNTCYTIKDPALKSFYHFMKTVMQNGNQSAQEGEIMIDFQQLSELQALNIYLK